MARNAAPADEPKAVFDAFPCVLIVSGIGMVPLGTSEKFARIGGDLCEQATRAVNAAEDYGRCTLIGEKPLFDMEYWSLEPAKLKVGASA